MIVAAAVKIGQVVLSMPAPKRHHDVLRGLHALYEDRKRHTHTYEQEVQGFLTDTGEFLDRQEAMKHALASGQGTPRRTSLLEANPNYGYYNGPDLYSEDLW